MMPADAQSFINLQWPFAQPLRRRFTLDKLQDEEAFSFDL